MNTALLLSIIAWICLELWIGLREWGEVKYSNDNHTKLLVGLLITVGLFISIFASTHRFIPIPGAKSIHLLIGIILICVGIVLRFLSVQTLGKFFRTTVMIQKKHNVITSGPYKYIRHPSYTGSIISFIGYGIALESFVSLFSILILVFIGMYIRMNTEEATLSKELGKEYKDYMKSTKRIIPLIY